MGSDGTRNHDWLCWRETAAIYPTDTFSRSNSPKSITLMVQIMQLLITCANIFDSPVTSPSSPTLIGLIYTNVSMFSGRMNGFIGSSMSAATCSWHVQCCMLIAQHFITFDPLWVYCTFINYFKRNNLTTKMSKSSTTTHIVTQHRIIHITRYPK
jgi:hypothetical protein